MRIELPRAVAAERAKRPQEGKNMNDVQMMTNAAFTAAVNDAVHGARSERSGEGAARGLDVALRAAMRLSRSTGLPVGVAAYVADVAAPGDGAGNTAIDDWLRGTSGDARRMLGDAIAAAELAIEQAGGEHGKDASVAEVLACAGNFAAEIAGFIAGRDVTFARDRLFGEAGPRAHAEGVAQLARAVLHAPRARRAEVVGVMARARRDGVEAWALPDAAALTLWAARRTVGRRVPSQFDPVRTGTVQRARGCRRFRRVVPRTGGRARNRRPSSGPSTTGGRGCCGGPTRSATVRTAC